MRGMRQRQSLSYLSQISSDPEREGDWRQNSDLFLGENESKSVSRRQMDKKIPGLQSLSLAHRARTVYRGPLVSRVRADLIHRACPWSKDLTTTTANEFWVVFIPAFFAFFL